MSEEKWDLRGYLGDKEFYKNVVRIAVPVSLQQLITVGINLMDTIMLSSMGDAQLSASALAGQFINLFQIFCMGIGMGASVLTSHLSGLCRDVYPGHFDQPPDGHADLYFRKGNGGLRRALSSLAAAHLFLYGPVFDLYHRSAQCQPSKAAAVLLHSGFLYQHLL